MTKKISFVLGLLLFIFCSQLFISSSFVKTSDNLHQQQFNNKYGVYSIIKPKDLLFANEKCPSSSPEIFERIDKELLKILIGNPIPCYILKEQISFFQS